MRALQRGATFGWKCLSVAMLCSHACHQVQPSTCLLAGVESWSRCASERRRTLNKLDKDSSMVEALRGMCNGYSVGSDILCAREGRPKGFSVCELAV